MKIPRILLCAGASGSGKTLITCGLLQLLKNHGKKAASFKCGPDYIDPMFHTKVIGTRSRNLDTFFTSREIVRYLLSQNSRDVNLAVMEGVMGYYDGLGGITTRASAYELACYTDTPSILIVNCKGMSVSVVPFIKGFLEYKKDSHIAGVILNQISGMLYPRVKEMIEQQLSIPVAGYLPVVRDCVLESRHLGLIMPEEILDFKEKLEKLSHIMEDTMDLDKILEIAGQASDIEEEKPWKEDSDYEFHLETTRNIGVAKDEAFCFIYEDNLKLLEQMGARIIPFSPLHDKKLPENLDGLILYGGYPELLAEELEKNRSMREDIRQACEKGLPVMAECGGFMYLHQWIKTPEGVKTAGAGVIPGEVYKTDSLKRFGYIQAESKNNRVFNSELGVSPAHEFHYYESENCGDQFTARKPVGKRSWDCIHGTETMMAGFPHFYYYGNPKIPRAFLQACERYHEKQRFGKEQNTND